MWFFSAFVAALITAVPATAEVSSLEVQSYAQEFDVSKGEAKRRLEIQQRGSIAQSQLERRLGHSYAGIWIDNNTGELVVPLLPSSSRSALTDELADAGLTGNYRTVPAQSSWDELNVVQARLDKALIGLIESNLVQTSLDPRRNAVVINQAKGMGKVEERLLQEQVEKEHVKIEVREKDVEYFHAEISDCQNSVIYERICGFPMRGGVGIAPGGIADPYCTAGFKAIDVTTGRRYMLTAGHCSVLLQASYWTSRNFDNSSQNEYLGYTEQDSFPGGDWAKINMTNALFWDREPSHSWIAWWGENPNYSQPITAEGSSVMNQWVCHSGITSGGSCGRVFQLDETVNYPEGLVYGMTAAYDGTLCSKGGDSGGPWFSGSIALGIHSGDGGGGCDVIAFYVEIKDATNALGVRVARDTEVTATVKDVLNGNPGWVTVEGNAYAGGGPGDGLTVEVKFSKWENNSWVHNATVRPTVSNSHYEVNSFRPGNGKWKVQAFLPQQGAFAQSKSGEYEFEIKDGYQIVPKHDPGKCLDIKEANTLNGAAVHQWTCQTPATQQNQVFTLIPLGNSYYRLQARHSGKCVDVKESNPSDGAQVQQWSCLGSGQTNQMWQGVPVGQTGYVELKAKHSGKCMDVTGGSRADGAAVQQWSCGGVPQQQWTFKSVDAGPVPTQTFLTLGETLNGQPGYVSVTGRVYLGAYINNKYVNINYQKEVSPGNWQTMSTVPVVPDSEGFFAYPYMGVGVGQWRVRAVFPGDAGPPQLAASNSEYHNFEIKSGYRFVFRHSGRCMDVTGGSTANGAAIQQWDCLDPATHRNQVFTLVPKGGGYYNIKNNLSGRCVDVTGGSTGNGAWLQQWDCNSYYQQQWQVVPISGQNGYFAFVAKHSGKCADVYGGSTANGTRLQQWTCAWTGNQQWSFQAIN